MRALRSASFAIAGVISKVPHEPVDPAVVDFFAVERVAREVPVDGEDDHLDRRTRRPHGVVELVESRGGTRWSPAAGMISGGVVTAAAYVSGDSASYSARSRSLVHGEGPMNDGEKSLASVISA